MTTDRKGSNMKNIFKKWKKHMACFTGIVIMVCFLPLPWRVNIKMNGIVYREEDTTYEVPATFVAKGWAYFYLLKTDTFSGTLYFQKEGEEPIGSRNLKCEILDGYECQFGEVKHQTERKVLAIKSMVGTEGPLELAWELQCASGIYMTGWFDEIIILYNKRNEDMQHDIFAVPANSREEALMMADEMKAELGGDFWYVAP